MSVQIGRNSRLGLRPVNPNPQPPNSPLYNRQQANQGAAGPGGQGGRGHGPHNGNNNRGNNQHGQGQGQGGQGHGQGQGQGHNGHGHNGHGQGGHGGKGGKGDWVGQNPPGSQGGTSKPPDPNNPFALPTYTPGAGQPDPRDTTYYVNVARLQAQAQQAYASDQLAQGYANTDYARAQEQMALNQQYDQQNLAGDALRSGLSSSGFLRKATAQQTGDYILRGGDLSSTYNRESAQRTADMGNLISNYGAGAQQELALATDRFQQLQAEQAAKGEGITTKADLKAIQKLLKKAKKGGGGKGGGGGGHGGHNGNGGHGGHGGHH